MVTVEFAFCLTGYYLVSQAFANLQISELLATENQDVQNNDDDCIDSPHAEIYTPSVYYLYLTFVVLFLFIFFFFRIRLNPLFYPLASI